MKHLFISLQNIEFQCWLSCSLEDLHVLAQVLPLPQCTDWFYSCLLLTTAAALSHTGHGQHRPGLSRHTFTSKRITGPVVPITVTA